MKIALVFACSPVHSNSHQYYLPLHSEWPVLGLVVESELKPESESAVAVAVAVAVAAAVAVALVQQDD